MSLAAYFVNKCVAKIEENIALALAKLSDPSQLVNIEVSGALADAAKGGMGGLADFAGDYIVKNADTLALAALNAAGLQGTALSALNLIYNMMAAAVSAYNDLILIFLKKVAQNIIVELDKKDEINKKLKTRLEQLLAALQSMNAGDPVFEKYLAQLRQGLIQLELSRRDLTLVRNTLDRSDRWLSKKFAEGKTKIAAAQQLIKPLADNPYLEPTLAGLAQNIGIPTEAEQISNILAVPKISKEILVGLKDYSAIVTKINAMLVFYYAGLNQLQTGMPALMKKFVLGLMDSALTKIDTLVGTMSVALNGQEGRLSPGSFKPVPLAVSVNAYKWAMDVGLIVGLIKAIPSGHVVVPRQAGSALRPAPDGDLLFSNGPIYAQVLAGDEVEIFAPSGVKGKYRVRERLSDYEVKLARKANRSIQGIAGVDHQVVTDALGALQLNLDAVNVYKGTVKELKSLGPANNGQAVLLATEAQENAVLFQNQLLGFLLEANGAIVSAKVRKEAIALNRAFINRTGVVITRDQRIRQILNRFIAVEIPFEETLKKLQEALANALKGLGLDKAADLLESGDFAGFFGLNGKSATYLGSALAAIALLKECFDNDADKAQLSDIQSALEGEQDLLSIKISFDFDFAILKNLEDCLNLNALAGLFNTKEVICGLLNAAGVGKAFDTFNDLLSF